MEEEENPTSDWATLTSLRLVHWGVCLPSGDASKFSSPKVDKC